MEWTFELSLTVFLIVSFISHYIAVATKSKVSLPLAFGVLFMAGFASGIFPRDFVQKTKLLEVGTIAFNVLIIHGGTMFSTAALKRNRNAVVLTLSGFAVSTLVIMAILPHIIGTELSVLAAPSVVGGGATCAIASVSVLRSHPEISFFPWLLFMLQCLFGTPIFAAMIAREKKNMSAAPLPAAGRPAGAPGNAENTGICSRIPERYKGTAFYLAVLMGLSLLNRLFFNAFLADTGLSLNLTALLIGIVIGELGILDRAPLMKADCFGLLMLGLMSLMANSLSFMPLKAILGMVPAALLCFAVCTAVLVAAGLLMAKPLGYSRQRAVALSVSQLVPVPVNIAIINGIMKPSAPAEKAAAGKLIAETEIGSLYIVNIISILLISIAVCFI